MKNKTTSKGKTSAIKFLTEDDFNVFTAEDFKAHPTAYKFNSYVEEDLISIRKELNSMKSYSASNIGQQLLKKMDQEKEIDTSVKFNIGFICKLATEDKLVLNLDELKDFVQRMASISAIKIMSRLIVSIINGDTCMPEIQTIVGTDPDSGKLVIYINDGMQRISTIVNFVQNRLVLKGTGTVLDGHTFSDLPDSIQEIFLNRLIRFHVIHKTLMGYRICFFKTLNLSSTRMTMGELVNTNYSSQKATQVAHDILKKNESVQKVFLPTNKKIDRRLTGESEILFAVACHYIYTENIRLKYVSGKCGMINKFMELDEVKRYDSDIRRLMNITPEVCEKMNHYFGPSFTKRIKTNAKYTTQNPHFPAQYEPNVHTSAVCSTYTSVLYFVTMMLFDKFGKLSEAAVQEIAMNIDTIFGSESFLRSYNTSVNAKKIINRMSYVMNEAVNPVLDKHGFDTFATRIIK